MDYAEFLNDLEQRQQGDEVTDDELTQLWALCTCVPKPPSIMRMYLGNKAGFYVGLKQYVKYARTNIVERVMNRLDS